MLFKTKRRNVVFENLFNDSFMQLLNCLVALNHIMLDFSGLLILACTTSDFRKDDSNGAFGCGSAVPY